MKVRDLNGNYSVEYNDEYYDSNTSEVNRFMDWSVIGEYNDNGMRIIIVEESEIK